MASVHAQATYMLVPPNTRIPSNLKCFVTYECQGQPTEMCVQNCLQVPMQTYDQCRSSCDYVATNVTDPEYAKKSECFYPCVQAYRAMIKLPNDGSPFGYEVGNTTVATAGQAGSQETLAVSLTLAGAAILVAAGSLL
ncbi:hypothetical protein IWQ60_010910 [Tieghemiomyces parasiticus]|uniref:Uncharacterized protein n=1 Tax=Tieghemiomyces parasiticus TaxID=78921 RepID=A0A9W7ZPI9_9FUNG|nr:hypothetical protein IWQ60_010910 [Tieghemiomyces parasiticus]